MHNGIAPQRSGRNSATQLYLQATSAQQQYTAVLQSRFVRKQSHSWSPPPHGGPQSSEGMCRGDCLESSPSTARARKRTRWGIGPRAFHTRDGCDTTTPCAHGILAQVGTYSSEHQCSSGRIQGSQPSPTLLLVCFVCVCVCCRGCLLGLAADWVPCRAAGKSMGQPPSQRAGQQHCARKRSMGGSNPAKEAWCSLCPRVAEGQQP